MNSDLEELLDRSLLFSIFCRRAIATISLLWFQGLVHRIQIHTIRPLLPYWQEKYQLVFRYMPTYTKLLDFILKIKWSAESWKTMHFSASLTFMHINVQNTILLLYHHNIFLYIYLNWNLKHLGTSRTIALFSIVKVIGVIIWIVGEPLKYFIATSAKTNA